MLFFSKPSVTKNKHGTYSGSQTARSGGQAIRMHDVHTEVPGDNNASWLFNTVPGFVKICLEQSMCRTHW